WRGGSHAASLCIPGLRCACSEPLSQLFVLLSQPTQLNDNLVQKVIDLVLVVSFAELGWLETLVDHVFWSQSHECHLQKLLSTPKSTYRSKVSKLLGNPC